MFRVFAALLPAVWLAVAIAAGPATRPATQPVAVVQALPKIEPADNSYCYTCHLNFQQETLALDHQKKGVGCATCHGESDKHSSDENGITPPDIMFAKSAINGACVKCHPAGKLIAKEEKHADVLAGAIAQKHCTDCHGKHVTKVRTRKWDKVTGKLIADDGVRLVEEQKQGDSK